MVRRLHAGNPWRLPALRSGNRGYICNWCRQQFGAIWKQPAEAQCYLVYNIDLWGQSAWHLPQGGQGSRISTRATLPRRWGIRQRPFLANVCQCDNFNLGFMFKDGLPSAGHPAVTHRRFLFMFGAFSKGGRDMLLFSFAALLQTLWWSSSVCGLKSPWTSFLQCHQLITK